MSSSTHLYIQKDINVTKISHNKIFSIHTECIGIRVNVQKNLTVSTLILVKNCTSAIWYSYYISIHTERYLRNESWLIDVRLKNLKLTIVVFESIALFLLSSWYSQIFMIVSEEYSLVLIRRESDRLIELKLILIVCVDVYKVSKGANSQVLMIIS